jgi:hypothetical protein
VSITKPKKAHEECSQFSLVSGGNSEFIGSYTSLLKHLLALICPFICKIKLWAVQGTDEPRGGPNPPPTQWDSVFLPRGVRCSAAGYRGSHLLCLKCSWQHKEPEVAEKERYCVKQTLNTLM